MVKLSYDKILEFAPIAYALHRIICDQAGKPQDYEFVEVNSAFEKLTNLSSERIVGKTVTEVLPEIKNDHFNWIELYGEIALHGGAKEFDQYSEPLDRWYRVNVFSPEKNYFITYFYDVSKEKLQYLQSENFFSANLDLFCIADTDGRFLRVNKAWEQTLGYVVKDLENKRFLELVHPEDIPATMEVIAMLQEQKEVPTFTNRYRTKDGFYRHIEWRSQPFGKLIYASARDITDRVEEKSAMAKMLNFSEEFIQLSAGKIDYKKITDNLLELSGAKYVELNLYDEIQETYSTVSASSFTEEMEEEASQKLRFSSKGNQWSNEQHFSQQYNGYILSYPSLLDYVKGLIPEEEVHEFERNFQTGQVIAIKVLRFNSVIGKFILIMPKNTNLKSQSILEIYTRQIGMLISRKEIEEDLIESEMNLKEAHSIARMGRWELNLKTNGLSWSDGIFDLFEEDRESFKASYEAFLEFVHPDDRELVHKTYIQSVEKQKPYEITHRLLMKDGTIKWVNEIGKTYYRENKPIRSVGTVQDITQRWQAEQALRENEEKT